MYPKNKFFNSLNIEIQNVGTLSLCKSKLRTLILSWFLCYSSLFFVYYFFSYFSHAAYYCCRCFMSVYVSFPFRAKKQRLLQSSMFISTITSWDYGYQFFLLYWHVVVSKLKLSIFCERKTPRIREMISFELGKEIEKDVFRLVTSLGQRKKSESPWVIEPQTFGFRARMLYHWATETTVSAEFEGLRFNSSWGIKNVFLFPTLLTTT